MQLAGESFLNDAHLIDRARRGDEAAWEELVREHQAAIFRLAYLMLASASDAEDTAQEAFIRAVRGLKDFDETRPLRPWLLSIVANLARNRRRSIGRYLQAITRAGRAEPEPVTFLGERSGQHWEAQTLWQAVRRLPRIDQEIIYLRYFLDLSESETAGALHVAPGTVKSRHHRAMSRLRAIVDTEFPALREEREA